MRVTVKTVQGKVLLLELEGHATLQDLKQAIQSREGVAHDQQSYAILYDDEADAIPYGEGRMNTLVKQFRAQGRFLKGNKVSSLFQAGVGDGSVLLLATGPIDSEPSDKAQTLDEKLAGICCNVNLNNYKPTKQEIEEALGQLSKLESRHADERFLYVVCGLVSALFRKHVKEIASTTVLKQVIGILKNCSHQQVAMQLLGILTTASIVNHSGNIETMLSLGVLDEAQRLLKENSDKGVHNYSDNQETVIQCLESIATNHESARKQIAALIYKDTFEKHDLFVAPDSFVLWAESHPDKYLWEEPWSIYTNEAESKKEFHVSLIEIRGINLAAKDKNGLSDPYLLIGANPPLDDAFKPQIKSSTIPKNLNPIWDMGREKHNDIVLYRNQSAMINVYDEDLVGSDFMGAITFPPKLLYALQQSRKRKMISLAVPLSSIEKKKEHKIHEVSGCLIVKMSITAS